MKLYSVSYLTESGDSGFAGLFDTKPTPGHLTALTLRDMPDEILREEGEEPVSCVFYTVAECEVSQLPEPVEPIDTI